MVKKPTAKDTKAQILTAYDDLLKEKKKLEAQLAQAAKVKLMSPPQSPSANGNGKTTVVSPEPARESVSLLQPGIEQILTSLDTLQLSFGGAVSELSEKLTREASQLEELQEAMAAEVQQLEALHGLQITDESLDELIQQYEDNFKTFNEAFSQRRETLEKERAEAKKVWEKEQEEHQRTVKERNDTLAKLQRRDANEYTYDLELQRGLASEQYEQERKSRNKQLEETEQAQKKQWLEREEQIAEQEKQFEEAKAKVEGFPDELEAGIKKAKEEGKGIAHQQAKVKADLYAKEVEGNRRFYELRLQSLESTIDTQDIRLETLSQQLDAALKQAQDLAVKAIEGASNAKSFQAMREIALEQVKAQTKGK